MTTLAPPPAYAPPPPASVAPPQAAPFDGFSIASFVCALCGLALIPVVLGHIGLAATGRRGYRGRGFAIAGLVIGYAQILLALLLIAVVVWFGARGVSGA